MEIDVAKVKKILGPSPGVSLGIFEIEEEPAVVAVLLDLRHLEEARMWVGGLIERETGGQA